MTPTPQTLTSAINTKDYGVAKEQFGQLLQARVASIVDRIKRVEATEIFSTRKA